ncbi:MAG: biotin transporter BioY [Tissierellia bacterium]|nr:biotin transporter BioY [Tissierellia bacterium]
MTKTRKLTRIGVFTALVAVGAFISIPMWPVAITLQTFFLMLAVLALPEEEAMVVPVIYFLLGIVGLPIFSGFSGGLASVFKPSFGFILGFIPATSLAAVLIKRENRGWEIKRLAVFHSILYIIGLAYMYFILNFHLGKGVDLVYVLQFGFLLFQPGDLLKAFLAILIAKRVRDVIR